MQSIPKRRYLDNMTSERVDAGGVSNIAKLLQSLPPANTQVRRLHRRASPLLCRLSLR